MEPSSLNGNTLAYLGDAVIELIARERVICSGIAEVGRLNRIVTDIVRASAQSAAIGRIEESLTEEETAVYKRGRNSHGVAVPKSASAAEYRRATGMEALFAALYLEGKRERLYELFDDAYGEFIAQWKDKDI